ncbi:DSPc-domain-containing protein [Basidiobolus meristosporus CBS 931.73]|uniref:protein-tyrosine-phosphatase n=1 Tax=Basidiobolus meristosporus CBS 931.73 TaxID=1314790 RepID=A0A1Y1XX21_9FUNG|nr:DSPc-domain-containing protein [Basidiobolus meristosporus CBS 931.73]|eukprot:ORX90299.1 DSPc-domain-containing protein [Basidiobolus meristosporus CBS 931.73]
MTFTLSNHSTNRLSSTSLPKKPLMSMKNRNSKNLSLALSGSVANSVVPATPRTPATSFRRSISQVPTKENLSNYDSPYVNGPVCILPYLYLGTEQNASSKDNLNKCDIHFILNVAKEVKNPLLADPQSVDATFTVEDGSDVRRLGYKKFAWGHNQENLSDFFETAFSYIDEARSRGLSVLVHCQCGVSRSASLIIAYVMRTLRMNVNEAYSFVKARSSTISPNMSLVYQLVDLEKTLNLEHKGVEFAEPNTPTLTRRASTACA